MFRELFWQEKDKKEKIRREKMRDRQELSQNSIFPLTPLCYIPVFDACPTSMSRKKSYNYYKVH